MPRHVPFRGHPGRCGILHHRSRRSVPAYRFLLIFRHAFRSHPACHPACDLLTVRSNRILLRMIAGQLLKRIHLPGTRSLPAQSFLIHEESDLRDDESSGLLPHPVCRKSEEPPREAHLIRKCRDSGGRGQTVSIPSSVLSVNFKPPLAQVRRLCYHSS